MATMLIGRLGRLIHSAHDPGSVELDLGWQDLSQR